MKVESFTAFSSRYARAMAGRHVRVTFGGRQAYTDGRGWINLPALPAGTMLTPWQTKVYNGYLDHEIAHLKYTKMENVKIDPNKEPLKRSLWNVFEDIRIENKLIGEFPPTKVYLDACTQQIEWDKKLDKRKAKQANKGKAPKDTLGYQLLSAIYTECYEKYRAADVQFESSIRIGQFPELAKIKAELARSLPVLQNEVDAANLATTVYDLLPKNIDYSANPIHLDPDAVGQLPIFIFIKGKAPPGVPMPMDALADAAVIFLMESDRAKGMETLQLEIDDLNSDGKPEKTRRAPNEWGGSSILPPAGTSKDQIFTPSKTDRDEYNRIRGNASVEITSSKRMLQIYLKSRTMKAWERGLPEGQLDDDALPSMFAGNVNLFKARRSRHLIETDIQLMVDNSGSMDENTTRLAAIILAEAISGISKMKLAIAGFTTNGHNYNPGPDGGSGVGRTVGLDLLSYKEFDEPYMQAAPRLGAIMCTGSTPLGEAYGHGFARLMMRKAPRRVLWTITDGDPYLPVADHNHNEYRLMEKTYRRCKMNDITVIAMNIGSMNVRMKSCADAAITVSNQRELPETMLQMMKEISK